MSRPEPDFVFDEKLRGLWVEDGDQFSITLPETWMQGRTLFGGMTSAIAASLGHIVAGDKTLRGANFSLQSPITPGEVIGRAKVTREGRNVSFVIVELLQGGNTCLHADLVFASPREAIECPQRGRWDAPPVGDLQDVPYLAGLMPEYMQHVQMRFAAGGVPYSGSDLAEIVGYCRFRSPSGSSEGIVGLLDAWPCASLALLSKPAPASTVSWGLQIHSTPTTSHDWFGYHASIVRGVDGIHTERAELFSPAGELIATSQQLVAIYG